MKHLRDNPNDIRGEPWTPETELPVPVFAGNRFVVFKRRFNLDQAESNKEVNLGASNFLWVVDASDLSATVDIRLNSQQSDPLPLTKGFRIGGFKFNRTWFSWSAQSGKWVDILAINSQEEKVDVDNPLIGFSAVSLANSSQCPSTTDVTLAATATTQIKPSDSARREIILQNLSNTVTLRIGDNNAGATRGIPLSPGEKIILSTGAAVYGYNPDAGTVDVSVLEITD